MKTTALLFSTLLLLAACSKPDDNSLATPPTTTIRIATVTEESTDYTRVYTLHYNADTSRVDSIIATGDIPENIYLTYMPNYTLIQHKQPNQPNAFIQDSVLLMRLAGGLLFTTLPDHRPVQIPFSSTRPTENWKNRRPPFFTIPCPLLIMQCTPGATAI